MKNLNRGIIQIYTGDGKGKTTAALGQTIRALGWGMSVCWVQFIKGNKKIGEIKFLKYLPKTLKKRFLFKQFHQTKRYSIGKLTNAHRIASEKAWDFAKKIISENKFDLLVLDELNNALEYNFLRLEEVIGNITNKSPNMELIITGRGANPKLLKIADLVTEMKCKKHPYNKNLLARKGIEF